MGDVSGVRAGGAGLVASMLVGVALGAADCASSGYGLMSGYAALLSRIVAANVQNHNNPQFTVVSGQHDVTMSTSTAFRSVVSGSDRGCS